MEYEEAYGKSCALNAIFNGREKKSLDSSIRVQLLKKLEIFSRLLMKALQSMSRLQLLTTKIENIRMKEGEKNHLFQC